MAVPNMKSVAEYIASQPEAVHCTLERVRHAIRKALPAADEVISYNMPTYKMQGITILNFAVWKRHYALYAATASVQAAFKHELILYDVIKGQSAFLWNNQFLSI